MNQFIQKYQKKVIGVLSGFDRLVLRGTLRAISYTAGMMNLLYDMGVLLKDFNVYVERTTKLLKRSFYGGGPPIEQAGDLSCFQSDTQGTDCQEDHETGRDYRWVDLPFKLCRAVYQLRYSTGSREEEIGVGTKAEEMSASVPLLDRSCVWVHECSYPNLVPLSHPTLSKRPGVALTTVGGKWDEV